MIRNAGSYHVKSRLATGAHAHIDPGPFLFSFIFGILFSVLFNLASSPREVEHVNPNRLQQG